ncbi:restriction endonuclease subunit S [Microbispora hainanensis]|uniref:restriction endonuclease subunit S n=1 Tax=Microbispora hainanensis TaxID=568844 RepID=UPI0033CCB9D4
MTRYVPLKRVAQIRYGLGQPPPLSEDGVPIIRATNIFRGKIDEANLLRAHLGDLPLDRAPLLREGEILVVRSGAYTGDSARITHDWAGSAPGYDLRLTPQTIDSRFAAYVLLSTPCLDQINLASSRAAQPHLNAEELGNVTLWLPPSEEQRRIANFLDIETARIDNLVRTEKRILELLHERRIAGVVMAVSGSGHTDRRPSSLTWLESIPQSWQEVRLNLLARMGSGHTPSRSHPEWWENCTIPWITTGEVKQVRDDRLEEIYETREKISEIGLANSAAELHPAGTVVLCRTASAGYSAVMGTDMATSQDFVTWTCGPKLDPYYLLWCLRAMRPDLLGRLAMGSTHKTIYVPDLQMLRIPLPPTQEQHQIVEQIRRQNAQIDRLVDAVKRQLDLLAERRQALITVAVTGQFDVSTASGRGVVE